MIGQLLSAASQHTQNLTSGITSALQNRAQTKLNKKLWDQQNAYNHPTQQMQRLKEAGLNPHLVYGNGAKTEAGSIDTAQVQIPEPKMDTLDGLGKYQNFKLQEIMTNNARKQGNVIEAEAILKAAQTAATVQNTSKSAFDLDLAKELRQTSVEAAKQNLQKSMEDTLYTNRQSFWMDKEKTANIKRTNAETSRAVQDAKLKALEAALRSQGLNPNDPTWQKMIALGLKNTGLTPSSIGDWIKKMLPW